jgi:hypothetical protein
MKIYEEHKKKLSDLIDKKDKVVFNLTEELIEQSSLLAQQINDIQDKVKETGHILYKKDAPQIQKELPSSKVLTRLQAQYNATILAIFRIVSKMPNDDGDDEFDNFQEMFKKRFETR